MLVQEQVIQSLDVNELDLVKEESKNSEIASNFSNFSLISKEINVSRANRGSLRPGRNSKYLIISDSSIIIKKYILP